MPIAIDESGVYVPEREDVKVNYTSMEFRGQTVYEYDSEEGILRLNKKFPIGKLEMILQNTDSLPDGGKRLKLTVPIGRKVVLQPVRKVEYIPEGIDLVTRIRNIRGYFSEYFQNNS